VLSVSASQELVVALDASAELPAPGKPAVVDWPGRLGAVASTALAAAITLIVVGAGLQGLGAPRPVPLYVLLGLGAVAARAWASWRRVIALAVGVTALVALNPMFGAVFAGLVGLLALCRRRFWPFVVLLLAGAVVLPKMAYARHYHDPGYWNWLNEPSLALALFASALWWRARASRGEPGGAAPDDALSFCLLYFLPGQAAFPMVFSPRALDRHAQRVQDLQDRQDWVEGPLDDRAPDLRAVAPLLGWFAAKTVALVLLRRLAPQALPHPFLRELIGADVGSLGRGQLWLVVFASYLELYLALAVTADVPVLLARLYGWSLPAPFRAALLAWNPVELWRRWGLYNRALLLQLIYFPLGGGARHRYRNVMLTFLGSALLLHSGWFGSKYWQVGPGGWRDETLYFLLQGLAVCACLRWVPQASHERAPAPWGARWSWRRAAGIAATQSWSALVHVVVLAQGIDLATRGRLIARCLGF